jgi:hypothetical protein
MDLELLLAMDLEIPPAMDLELPTLPTDLKLPTLAIDMPPSSLLIGDLDTSDEGGPSDEYLVDKILERRLICKVEGYPQDEDYEYLVSWAGYTAEDNTWEPFDHMTDCSAKLQEFKDRLASTKTTRKRKRGERIDSLNPTRRSARIAAKQTYSFVTGVAAADGAETPAKKRKRPEAESVPECKQKGVQKRPRRN